MTTTACHRCHAAPAICVGLCRRCGLREADTERRRRARAERRQYAATRFDRRQQEAARHWQAPPVQPMPEDAA